VPSAGVEFDITGIIISSIFDFSSSGISGGGGGGGWGDGGFSTTDISTDASVLITSVAVIVFDFVWIMYL